MNYDQRCTGQVTASHMDMMDGIVCRVTAIGNCTNEDEVSKQSERKRQEREAGVRMEDGYGTAACDKAIDFVKRKLDELAICCSYIVVLKEIDSELV